MAKHEEELRRLDQQADLLSLALLERDGAALFPGLRVRPCMGKWIAEDRHYEPCVLVMTAYDRYMTDTAENDCDCQGRGWTLTTDLLRALGALVSGLRQLPPPDGLYASMALYRQDPPPGDELDVLIALAQQATGGMEG